MNLFCNGHSFLFLHAVTVVCTNDLYQAFPKYAPVVVFDSRPNDIHATVICVPIENFV